MENCGRFVFYNNIYFFFFTKNQNQKKKNGTAWILSQTIALDQSAREDSLSYCKKYNGAQSQNDENTL